MLNGNQSIPSTSTKATEGQKDNDRSCPNTSSHNLSQPITSLNWLIHLQHVRSELDSCKQLIRSEIERSGGKNDYAIYKQGVILRKEGKQQEALDALQKSLKLNPNNIITLKEMAECLFEMKRYKLALNAYLEVEALLKVPDWEIYYYIALCLLELKRTDEAKKYTMKSIQVGKQENAYMLLIKILISERSLKSAIEICNSAIDCCPESVNLMIECGLLYYKFDQLQESFECYSRALALEPANDKALLGVGCITLRHEEFDVALNKLKTAVLYNSESVALWNNIGICLYYKQKYVAAVSCLKRALYISPLNWRVLHNLALVHLMVKQPASAFNFAAAAANLKPNKSECFTLMAYALHYLKDNTNALKAIKHSFTLKPIDIYTAANAALFAEITGNKLEADSFIKKYEELSENAQGQDLSELNKLIENIKITRNLEQDQSSNLQESSDSDQNKISEIKQVDDISNINDEDVIDLLENDGV